MRSVRRGLDRRADSHRRNHGGRCLSPLRDVGRAALRPLDVRPKAELRKNESQGVVSAPRRDATPARALTALDMGGQVLVIGPNAALRVRGGALVVEHGFKPDLVRVRIDVDQPKPAATCSTRTANS